MSLFTLIRHGQAGTRNRYDALSELGARQAQLLGESLAAQQRAFTAVYAGSLVRQQETAAIVVEAFIRAGRPLPAMQTDEGWNEFDIDAVTREIAPVLAARDAQFRAEWDEINAQCADESHEVHRRWSNCDVQVIRAWASGAVPVQCETFAQFQARIDDAWRRFASREEDALIFTSATPIANAVGLVLSVDPRMKFRLAGALYNASVTELRVEPGEASLFSFNSYGHLLDPELRTLR